MVNGLSYLMQTKKFVISLGILNFVYLLLDALINYNFQRLNSGILIIFVGFVGTIKNYRKIVRGIKAIGPQYLQFLEEYCEISVKTWNMATFAIYLSCNFWVT